RRRGFLGRWNSSWTQVNSTMGRNFRRAETLNVFALEKQSAVVPTLGEFGWQWIQERRAAIESPTPPPTTTRSFSKLMAFNPRSQSGDSTKFTMVTSTL